MKYANALIVTTITGLATLATALGDDVVSPTKWVTIASSVLLALGAVWAVPNRPDAE